jgi:hypothetical protein
MYRIMCSILVPANIRRLKMTCRGLFLVHAAPAIMLAQDITGTTVLSLTEGVMAPATAKQSASLSVGIRPAPYGFVDLSKASITASIPPVQMLAHVSGLSGGGWIDLQGSVARVWLITPSFTAASQLIGTWQGAVGFPARTSLAMNIHTIMALNPTWLVGCGVDGLLQLHSDSQPPTRTLRLGVGWQGAAAAELAIAPGQYTSLMLSALYHPSTTTTLRGRCSTWPITLSVGARLLLEDLPDIVAEVSWVERLGYRAALSLDVRFDG